MAKNLAYVKRYEEDLADLGLCFEWTEDVMGRMESYELREGGRDISVTNENRIRYIHRNILHIIYLRFCEIYFLNSGSNKSETYCLEFYLCD